VEIIIFMLIVFFVVSLLTPKPGKSNSIADRLVIEKKQCPPHQWFWQEIVDQDGNKHGERIVCKVCGPLSNNVGSRDSE
jgi:hypothetical protein